MNFGLQLIVPASQTSHFRATTTQITDRFNAKYLSTGQAPTVITQPYLFNRNTPETLIRADVEVPGWFAKNLMTSDDEWRPITARFEYFMKLREVGGPFHHDRARVSFPTDWIANCPGFLILTACNGFFKDQIMHSTTYRGEKCQKSEAGGRRYQYQREGSAYRYFDTKDPVTGQVVKKWTDLFMVMTVSWPVGAASTPLGTSKSAIDREENAEGDEKKVKKKKEKKEKPTTKESAKKR